MSSKPEGFAAVPNWMVRDESFDIYDIAVYLALASHTGPGGVRPSQATLAAEARCSERQVRNVILRLVEAGVVEVTRRRRKGSGSGRSGALTNGYVLHPHGRLAVDEEAAPYAGTSDQPAQGDRPTGTGAQIAPLIEEEPLKKSTVVLDSESFDRVWAAWPRREGKQAAIKAHRSAVKRADRNVVEVGAVRAARSFAARPADELRFVPYLSSWLNGSRWEDEAPALVAAGPQSLTEKWGAGNEWMEYR